MERREGGYGSRRGARIAMKSTASIRAFLSGDKVYRRQLAEMVRG